MFGSRVLPNWQDVADFYDHLTQHIVPGPRSMSYFIPLLLPIIVLCIPPRHLSCAQLHWFVLPVAYTFQAYVWIYHGSFDVISMNTALQTFLLLGWYDARQDFCYVRRLPAESSISTTPMKDGREIAEVDEREITQESFRGLPPTSNATMPFVIESYPISFFSRLKWAIALFSSLRLTDWRIGLPSHDLQQPGPIKPFSQFVSETLTQGMFLYVLLDFTSPYVMRTACINDTDNVAAQQLLGQVSRALFLLAHLYAALSLFTALLPHLMSICALILAPSLRLNSMASPLTWPGHFGPFSSIYSRPDHISRQKMGLRAFWGIFWHQNMRYITSTPGVALASALDLGRGSFKRYVVIVASGFFWSGVVHMGVVPPQPIGTILGPWEMRFRLASFFWLQIVGVIIEEAVELLVSTTRLKQVITKDTKGHRTRNGQHKIDRTGLKCIAVDSAIKSIILAWTIGFLAFTAWWAAFPVACELGWFNIRFPTLSYFGE